jgi:hypothetical protein
MTDDDKTPLPNTLVSATLQSSCNNRYGAVLSALYNWWSTREPSALGGHRRRDAYSVITFDTEPVVSTF